METEMPDLTLRRITWADGQPSLDPEVYSVREGDRDVGRRPGFRLRVVYLWHVASGIRGDVGGRQGRMEEGPRGVENCAARSDPVKEIVLVTLAVGDETG
jgi:hypothetical protein